MDGIRDLEGYSFLLSEYAAALKIILVLIATWTTARARLLPIKMCYDAL